MSDKKQVQHKIHWSQQIPQPYDIAGIGDIRVLNQSKANRFQQSFMAIIRERIEQGISAHRYWNEEAGKLKHLSPVMDWESVEEIVDDVIENAEAFTLEMVTLLTPDGIKELAMSILKAECAIVNLLYPMTAEDTERIITARENEFPEN